jgi:hypothetical protein
MITANYYSVLILVIQVVLIVAIVWFHLNYNRYTKDTTLKLYGNNVRYHIADEPTIIVNTKDCSKMIICKMAAVELSDTCSDCKQINSKCVHFDEDTPIEIDGVQSTVLKNEPGEGYCLQTNNIPNRECNVWGEWMLVKTTNDSSYAWVCKCKYPTIFDSDTLLGNCIESKICERGSLTGIDTGLPDHLECTCSEENVQYVDSMGLPHCRTKTLYRDGVYYSPVSGGYIPIDQYFNSSNIHGYTISYNKIPRAFNMPDVYVISPHMLSIAKTLKTTNHGWKFEWLKTTSSTRIWNYRIPIEDESEYIKFLTTGGPYGIMDQAMHKIEWQDPPNYDTSFNNFGFVYSKIVLDIESDDSPWYELPWGPLFTLYELKQKMFCVASAKNGWWIDARPPPNNVNAQYICSFLVDPAQDLFEGRLVGVFHNNMWIYSPLPTWNEYSWRPKSHVQTNNQELGRELSKSAAIKFDDDDTDITKLKALLQEDGPQLICDVMKTRPRYMNRAEEFYDDWDCPRIPKYIPKKSKPGTGVLMLSRGSNSKWTGFGNSEYSDLTYGRVDMFHAATTKAPNVTGDDILNYILNLDDEEIQDIWLGKYFTQLNPNYYYTSCRYPIITKYPGLISVRIGNGPVMPQRNMQIPPKPENESARTYCSDVISKNKRKLSIEEWNPKRFKPSSSLP